MDVLLFKIFITKELIGHTAKKKRCSCHVTLQHFSITYNRLSEVVWQVLCTCKRPRVNPKLLWLLKAAVNKILSCFGKQHVTKSQIH